MADVLDRITPLVNSDQFAGLDNVGRAEFRDKAFSLFLQQDPEKQSVFAALPPEKQALVQNKFSDELSTRFPHRFTTGGFRYLDNDGLLTKMPAEFPLLDTGTEKFVRDHAPFVEGPDGEPQDNPAHAALAQEPDPATKNSLAYLMRSRYGDDAAHFDIPDELRTKAVLHEEPSKFAKAAPAIIRAAGSMGVPAAVDAATDGLGAPASAAISAAGAAAAEPFAQMVEKSTGQRADYSLPEGAVNVAASLVRTPGVSRLAPFLSQVGAHAATGGMVTAGQEAADEAMHGEINPAQIGKAGLAGAAVGAIAGSLPIVRDWLVKGQTPRQAAIDGLDTFARQNGYTGSSTGELKEWYRAQMNPAAAAKPSEPINVTPPAGQPQAETAPPAPAEAAPAVSTPAAAPEPAESPAAWTAKTPDDTKTPVGGVWRIVDAADIKTSRDEGYDQTLQPRDRSRAASQQQISSIATHLDPDLLGDSVTTDLGAPVINDKGMVLSGNGRTEAIREAYNSEGGAGAYRAHLEKTAADLGIAPADVQGMKQPVLVRQVTDFGGLEPQEFARRSNRAQVLGMSDSEKAAADGQMVLRNSVLLDKFRPSDEGDVLAASNRDFLNDFIEATGERAELISKDGQGYNPKLAPRVRNAVLAALVGPENRHLVDALVEDNEGARRVVAGLLTTAPRLLRFKGTDYDLGQPLAKALSDLTALRRSGQGINDYLGQASIFGDEGRTNESDFILQTLDRAKSAKAVQDFLGRYAELAGKIDTTTGDMFGTPNATRADLTRQAAAVPGGPEGRQADFQAHESGEGAAEPDRAVGPADAGGAGQGRHDDQSAGEAAGDVELAEPVWDERRNARNSLNEHARGKRVVNEATGHEIEISTAGINKATSGQRQNPLAHLEAVRQLPGLLGRAQLVETHPDLKDKGFTGIERYEAPVTVGGTDYTARMTVRLRGQHRQFYDFALKTKAPAGNPPGGSKESTGPGQQQTPGEETLPAAPSQAGAAGGPPVVPPSPGAGGPLQDPDLPQNNPNFSQLPIELPEMVQLGKALLGGQYPRVLKSLSALRGNALGVFKVRDGVPSIELRADTFNLVQPPEKRLLKEQAVEYARLSKQADPTIDEAEVARDRYEQLLSDAVEKAKLQNPQLASKVLAHEIGHLDDWLPQHAMPKGNIFAHIAALKRYTKRMISELPPAEKDLFKPSDMDRFRRRAEQVAGPKPSDPAALETWRAEVGAFTKRFADMERRARGLTTLEEIKTELRPVIAWWRGTPTMEDYFEDPAEMYAEAFSVVLNNPAAIEARAPKFTKLFFNYLSEHPETQILYGQIQSMIKSGAIARQRVFDLREGFRAADQAGIERDARAQRRSWPEVFDDFRAAVDANFAPIYRRLKANPDKSETDPVDQALGDYLYRTSAHELFLRHMNNRVLAPLHASSLDWGDLGEYIFHTHVVNNRANIANSQGWNARSSRQRLLEWSQQLGPERFKALVDGQKAFRAIYENQVIAPLRAANLLSPQLLKAIESRSFYATVSAKRDVGGIQRDTIEDAMISAYGPDLGPKIYKQVGYLGDIKNPATATVKKAIALISMTYREVAKRHVATYLLQNDPIAAPAEMRWTGHGRQPVQVQTPRVGTIMYLQEGKLRAFYVPRAIADMFETHDGVLQRISSGMGVAAHVVKGLFTHWNPGFWPVLAARNAVGYRYQMPGGGYVAGNAALLNPAGLLPGRQTLLGEAWRAAGDLSKGRPNSVVDAVLRRKMAASRAGRYNLSPEDEAFEGLLRQYGLNPRSWDGQALGPADRLIKLWMAFNAIPQRIDATFRIAGMLALDRQPTKPGTAPMTEAQKRKTVQERAGGAKYRDAGTGAGAIEFVLPFFNALKQHARAFVHAAKDQPGDMALKFLMGAGAAGVALWMAENGLLDREPHAKDFGEMLRSIPEYDKSNYLCVPLGWSDRAQKKVMYVRLPLIEAQRLAHQLVRGALQKLHGDKAITKPSALSFAAEQTPNINPLLQVGYGWWQYEIQGHNPYDSFRGSNVIPEKDYLASRGELLAQADVDLLKWSSNQLTGGVLGRFTNPNLYSTDGGGAEAFLRLPEVSNLAGRWLKVSNQGAQEPFREAEAQFQKERAQLQLAGDDMLLRMNRGQPLTDDDKALLGQEPDLVKYIAHKEAGVLSSQGQTPEVQALTRARSAKEKSAMLQAAGQQ